jgi:glycopeptide antibiotics resistance protein
MRKNHLAYRQPKKHKIAVIIFFDYVWGLLVVTLGQYIVPALRFIIRCQAYNYFQGSVNIIPFRGILSVLNAGFNANYILNNIVGNIFLFMPLGFLLSFLWKKFDKFVTVLAIALFSSIVIELLQIPLSGSTDIDDVILNVLGAIFGFLLLRLFKKTVFKNSDKR